MTNWGVAFDQQTIDEAKKAFKKHQELSRTASAGKFKGGLADAGEMSKKYHTASHILLQVLRNMFGEQVIQKGSNITPERMRFDFAFDRKLTPEEISEIEKQVNEIIQKDLPLTCAEMHKDEAKKSGAHGVFESKYGERVKVYTIELTPSEAFSKEICGGPHATHTG